MTLNSRSRRASILTQPSAVDTSVSPVTHGLLALIFPVLGQVCQWLMVLSYCTPGSAQAQADSATVSQSLLASRVSTTLPVVRAMVCHLPPDWAARMNSSLTRTE